MSGLTSVYRGVLLGLLCETTLATCEQESAPTAREHLQVARDERGVSQSKQSMVETWHLMEEKQFFLHRPPNSFTGLYRTQGIATDGDKWFFSWQYGLEIANNKFESVKRNSWFDLPATVVPGIPPSLLRQGLNHIGDIDYDHGIIYASLDATDGYSNGHVVLYDAVDLTYTGVAYELIGAPSNPKNDIASWVAVDAKRNLGYGKEWQSGNTINVYSLPDWNFTHTLTLDRLLERIQGGKVQGNWLYMAADDATRSVYRANVVNGHVEELFRLPVAAGDREVEGIAVRTSQRTLAASEACDNAVDIYVAMIVDPDRSRRDPANPNLHVSVYHYIPVVGHESLDK